MSEPRVLILSASVGEGHDLPARVLAADLRQRAPGVEVEIADGLVAMGRAMTAAGERGMRATFGVDRMHWAFDLQYLAFARVAPTRALGQWLMHRVSGERLARFVRERAPDVVVSTHPAVTEGLGQLRRRGELDMPAVSAVTDLASLRYWASRGIDVHLLTHPESAEEVRRIAGPATRIEPVHGLTDPAFLDPPSPAEARRALGLPAEGGVVAVSGGGWAVGDLDGAIRGALSATPAPAPAGPVASPSQPATAAARVAAVLCLCGRNRELRERLEAGWAGEPRVRVMGFVERMVEVMAAADVLVHSTAGLTVLEAWMLGCRPISYGWGIGHIRLNNRAFRRFGIAEVVGRRELPQAIARALAAPRVWRVGQFARLPSAAEVLLEVVGQPASATKPPTSVP